MESAAGRTWKMMVLRFKRTAASRRVTSSYFCSKTLRPGLEGQSMLATVATQAARNSRGGEGGVIGLGS